MDASPKDLLYSELATTGARLSAPPPRLRFKDICKRGMKACDVDTNTRETLVVCIISFVKFVLKTTRSCR